MRKSLELKQKAHSLLQQVKAVRAKVDAENREMTEAERTECSSAMDKADAFIAESLLEERAENYAINRIETPAPPAPTPSADIEVKDRSEEDPKGGFKDNTDFLTAVMKTTQGVKRDSRLVRFSASRFRATQGSDEQGDYSDPHGGYLVPTAVAPGVLTVTAEEDPLASLVTNIPMSAPSVTFNARTDKNHSSSVSGGLTVTRRPETVDGSSSRMAFEQVILNAHELFGLTFATEAILEDSPESFIAMLSAGFADEFGNKLIAERLTGGGSGEFLGVIGADCTVSVAKETGQQAASIVTENIDKMEARCWKYGKAVWLANHNVKPQLKGLVRVVGTGGSIVPYFTTNPTTGVEMLDGRPIFFTEHAKTVGTVGDLILGVWSEYLQGLYKPMRQAESIHVRFLANERAFKFWLRNDGAPWWKAALTPKNGSTLSPFVTLAARA